jgi:hypothetical protein
MVVKSLHMTDEMSTGTYPRKLRPKELDLLETVLPADRPGYREYRELLAKMSVTGEGRRGAGNLVLGFQVDRPDVTSPLPPVVAYGMVETTRDRFSITVRECVDNQIDIEIVSSHGEEIPDSYEEKRRWTYSTWKLGEPLPSNGEKMREVQIAEQFVLGIAVKEKRVLLHDALTGIVHLIPVTNFYNELMLHREIREANIALNSSRLFTDLHRYTDDDLRAAFVAYNKLKRRVSIAEPQPVQRPASISSLLKTLLRKQGT